VSRIAAIFACGLTALLVSGCNAGTTAGGHSSARDVAAKKSVKFLSVSPAPGATGVNGASTITVTYSAPLPASAPFPSLSPAIAGTWQRRGDTAVFTPEAGFPPRTRVTVTIPAVATSAAGGSGSSGIASGLGASGTASARTASAVGAITASFTTGSYSALRLQEVLAQLGYLPLTWSPAPGETATVVLTARFGSPQSLGCVELPYSAAKQAYPLLPYGTLVTVLAS